MLLGSRIWINKCTPLFLGFLLGSICLGCLCLKVQTEVTWDVRLFVCVVISGSRNKKRNETGKRWARGKEWSWAIEQPRVGPPDQPLSIKCPGKGPPQNRGRPGPGTQRFYLLPFERSNLLFYLSVRRMGRFGHFKAKLPSVHRPLHMHAHAHGRGVSQEHSIQSVESRKGQMPSTPFCASLPGT